MLMPVVPLLLIIMLIGLFEIGQLARSNKVTSPPASGG
jgi:hypothetical protein